MVVPSVRQSMPSLTSIEGSRMYPQNKIFTSMPTVPQISTLVSKDFNYTENIHENLKEFPATLQTEPRFAEKELVDDDGKY